MTVNLIASKDIRRARLEICTACPVFNSVTRSCGSIVKDALRKKPVTVKGVTFSPCGCQIDAKAIFTIASCPGGFWGSEYMTFEEKLQLKEYLIKSGDTFNLTDIRNWANKANKSRNHLSNCASCVRKLRDDLWNMVKDIELPLPAATGRTRGPRKQITA